MNKREEIKQKLVEEIVNAYGFQEDKIKNPVRSGTYHVSFSVNGIQYSGEINYRGVFSTLQVEGYSINEEKILKKDCIYNRYFRHEKIVLLKKNEKDEWEDTGIRFNIPQEAEKWIRLSNVEYMYMCKPEGSYRKK